MIEEISVKAEERGIPLTIVFDAARQPGLYTRGYHRDVEIVFTSAGESADDHLIDQIHHADNPRAITLISSDGQLAWRARSLGAKTMKVEEFVRWISRKKEKKKAVTRDQREAYHNLSSLKVKLPPLHTQPSPKKKMPTKKPQQDKGSRILPKIRPGAGPTECFEFYLEAFEKRLKNQNEESE